MKEEGCLSSPHLSENEDKYDEDYDENEDGFNETGCYAALRKRIKVMRISKSTKTTTMKGDVMLNERCMMER